MLVKFTLTLFVLFLPFLAEPQVSQNFLSESQPQYELGVGAIGLNLPDYPGSRNNRFRVIPFPYYIYRGKYLRADDEGTRARFLASKRHELGVSFGLNFPVKSNDNTARVGMPNLDALVAIGPRFLFRFLTDDTDNQLNFSLAARAVFSSKLSFNNLFRSEGWSYEPRFSYWHKWPKSQFTLFTSIGFEFGSAQYAQYFYEVQPHQVTSFREEFHAQAGLIETSTSVGMGQFINSEWFIFAAVSFRNLDWAQNRDSPLVETRNNTGLILGAVWTFYESDEKVIP